MKKKWQHKKYSKLYKIVFFQNIIFLYFSRISDQYSFTRFIEIFYSSPHLWSFLLGWCSQFWSIINRSWLSFLFHNFWIQTNFYEFNGSVESLKKNLYNCYFSYDPHRFIRELIFQIQFFTMVHILVNKWTFLLWHVLNLFILLLHTFHFMAIFSS